MDTLPVELIDHLLSFVIRRYRYMLVCRQWHQLLTSDKLYTYSKYIVDNTNTHICRLMLKRFVTDNVSEIKSIIRKSFPQADIGVNVITKNGGDIDDFYYSIKIYRGFDHRYIDIWPHDKIRLSYAIGVKEIHDFIIIRCDFESYVATNVDIILRDFLLELYAKKII